MKIVIPVRESRSNESLRYALRAWEKFMPSAEIVLIGGKPHWYRGVHYYTQQLAGKQWTHNFPAALDVVTREFGTEEYFIWTADDIFPFRGSAVPKDSPEHWPMWCRTLNLSDYVEAWNRKNPTGYTGQFVRGIESQMSILHTLRPLVTHNADMHMPHVLRRDRVEQLLTILRDKYPDHPAGHFRAIYGGLWPGRVARMPDPKVSSRTVKLRPDARWVSTAPTSWMGYAGQEIRNKFRDVSSYER